MKEHALTQPGWSVRAFLDGRKSQVRMPADYPSWMTKVLPPVGDWFEGDGEHPIGKCGHKKCSCIGGGGASMFTLACPYAVGDRIWIRETWQDYCPLWDGSWCGHGTKQGIKNDHLYIYRATNPNGELTVTMRQGEIKKITCAKWKSPATMPRWASRLTLEITSRRLERVCDISYEDALAEGAMDGTTLCERQEPGKLNTAGETAEQTARRLQWPQRDYAMRWNKLHPHHPWETTWCWALGVKVVAND